MLVEMAGKACTPRWRQPELLGTCSITSAHCCAMRVQGEPLAHQRVIAATDRVHRQKPLCCPWSPCEDLVPPQRRALPNAFHAAARGDRSFLRYSEVRCKFCSLGRSA